MRVACLQICSSDSVAANLDVVARLLDSAAKQGVELAVLPEMFPFMHPDFERKQQSAHDDSLQTVIPFLADAAVRYSLHIVGGSLLLPGERGKLRNSCPVFSAEGVCLGYYDKIHLFDVDLQDRSYHESEQIIAGEQPRIFDLGAWRLGLSICYDLRFPELYRHYAGQGVQLLPIPSAFTIPTGRAHWEVLLRARAIENQAYVLAAAQIGRHPGSRETYGHSMIIDPWGIVVARADNRRIKNGEVVVADIDLSRVARVRSQIPALSHRRSKLFSEQG